MRLLTVVPLAAAFGMALFACKKEEPEPQYPTNQYPPTQTAPAQTAPPVATGGAATPVAASMAGPFLTGAITLSSQGDTKGMNPEGNAFAGQFQQGQTLEQGFQAEPGRCYTVVGAGGPGVSELDIQIALQLPLPVPAMYQDNQSGPTATVGGGGNCVKNPAPLGVPAKVILKVTSGSGYAAAQIFKK